MRIQSVKKKYKIKKERYQAILWGDILEYKGKYYSLTGSRIPYLRNKAVDDRFFILTLFAIAYENEAAGAYDPDEIMDVQLAVGLLNEAVCFPQVYAASVPMFGKLCERMIDLRSPSRRGQRKNFANQRISGLMTLRQFLVKTKGHPFTEDAVTEQIAQCAFQRVGNLDQRAKPHLGRRPLYVRSVRGFYNDTLRKDTLRNSLFLANPVDSFTKCLIV